MTLKELGKRVIEVLSSNKCGTVPQEWLDGLEELGRIIVKALNNKRGSWGFRQAKAKSSPRHLCPILSPFLSPRRASRSTSSGSVNKKKRKAKTMSHNEGGGT